MMEKVSAVIDRESSSLAAIHDFRRARQQANLNNIIGHLIGRPSGLFSFDEVKHKLKGSISGGRRLEDVPLDAIVGSVGRYTDFNRQFLPRNDRDELRWTRVKTAIESPAGVPLSPYDSPDDLILKAEYAEFLDRTKLDEQHPHADLRVTSPGRYAGIEEEIAAHRATLAAEQGHDVSFEAAAASWYDTIYLPVIDSIRRQGILRDFPERTETDLYVWLAQ